jgi:hypothetical protein
MVIFFKIFALYFRNLVFFFLGRTFFREVCQGLYKDALFLSEVFPQRLRTQKLKSDRPTKQTQKFRFGICFNLILKIRKNAIF